MFDDGAKVYIQFPSGLAQSEAPPLFVIGPDGKPALVNYRVRGTTYIVDRLFAAASCALALAAARRPHRAPMPSGGDAARPRPIPTARQFRKPRRPRPGVARQAAAGHAHQPQGADRRRGSAAPHLRHRAGGPAASLRIGGPQEPSSTTSRSPTGCRSCPPLMIACGRQEDRYPDIGAGCLPDGGADRSHRRGGRKARLTAWPARPRIASVLPLQRRPMRVAPPPKRPDPFRARVRYVEGDLTSSPHCARRARRALRPATAL